MQLRTRRFQIAAFAALLPLHFVVAQRWERIGGEGAWKSTTVVTAMNGMFWSIESNGTLYWTTPYGAYGRVGGEGSMYGTTSLVALDGILFNVRRGTLYYSDLNRNRGGMLDALGQWRRTAVISPMNSYLWSIETNGDIYKTDEDGSYRLIGKFAGARFFAAMGGKLWAIDGNGTMWFNIPGETDWKMIAQPRAFTRTTQLVTSPDYLWTLDNEGNMWRGDSSGHWSQVGATGEYKRVSNIVVLDGHLYAIRDGSLYRTH